MDMLVFVAFGFVFGILTRAMGRGARSVGLLASALLAFAGSFAGTLVIFPALRARVVTDTSMIAVAGGVGAVALLWRSVARSGRRGAS